MSEEVTYANLKFQDSSKIEHVQKFDQVGVKAPPAPFHGLRKRDLALMLLCLLLVIGLGVLGSVCMYYPCFDRKERHLELYEFCKEVRYLNRDYWSDYKLYVNKKRTLIYLTSKKEMEKFKKLQNVKEELQKNVSLQLMYTMDISKKIRNISTTLQELATKLCYELYTKKPEHRCKPCPKRWMWHEDRCYKLFNSYDTWQNSDRTCSAYNASLLKIKNKSVLEFIKSQRLDNYWLGLSPSKDYRKYENLDEAFISLDWLTRNTSDLSDGAYCGFITSTKYVYYTSCTSEKYSVCEKLANPVKIESTLMNEEPDGRM